MKKMGTSVKKSPRMSFRRARVVRTPTNRNKPESDSSERDQRIKFLGKNEGDDGGHEEISSFTSSSEEIESGGNKVMVVVDKSLASMGALEWALSHTVQKHDTIFLLYVTKPSRKGKKNAQKHNLLATERLSSMKNVCEKRRPGVQVEITNVEGKDKGPKIVQKAKEEQVSLLVLGEEKKPLVWRLFKRWASKRRSRCRIVEFCLQNSPCMTIAVRQKSSKLGGYLITTKRHKNFWLLA